MTQHQARILLILPRQLGDVILGLPMLHELRKLFPAGQIYWVAHPLAAEVLEGQPELSGVLYLPQGKRAYAPKRKGAIGRIEKAIGQFLAEIRFARELHKLQADVLIDAMNNPRTSLLSLFSGVKQRISFRTRFHRNLSFTDLIDRKELSGDYLGNSRLNLLAPLRTNSRKAANNDTSLAKQGQATDPLQALFIWRSAEQKARVTQLLASFECDLNQTPFVIVCPVSRREVRRWPQESFLELARALVFKHGLAVVWLWGPGEEQAVRPLHDSLAQEIKQSGTSANTSGSFFLPLLTIKEAAELSSRALCWVGNTSGLAHVAVAAACRTVEIHGPTNPLPWTHPDRSMHRAVTRASGCLACERYTCQLPRRECLEDLSAQAVLFAIEDLLNLKQTQE